MKRFRTGSLLAAMVALFMIGALFMTGCGGGGGGGTPLSSAKAITAFSIYGAEGTIDETAKTIDITMSFGTDVSSMIATFTTTGESVWVGDTVQTSDLTANDFTSPVIYTVTAADGSTADYNVTVTVAPSSAKAITAYSLPYIQGFFIMWATGTINEATRTISVTIPFGKQVSDLAATFKTTGESVKVGATAQISGETKNNFTSPVLYTVTAADGTTANYYVTVTVAASTANEITSFSLDGMQGIIDEAAKTISVTMPFGTDATDLIATFTTTGASVKVGAAEQQSGQTANNFTNPVLYTVTAADNSTATYTVTVTVESSAIKLPKTGQTTTYAAGDDGYLQQGIAWPEPRFTVGTGDEANCVTDNLTGLMWVRAPDLTKRAWLAALNHANGLSLCGYSDWRLPNINELESLITAESNSTQWLNTQGFSNLPDVGYTYYWSSTTFAPGTTRAWSVYMSSGSVQHYNLYKSDSAYVLPVRTGGQAAPAKLPWTGQLTTYAAGDDGVLRKGVAWPNPRFTVGTGAEADCVTDNLTGLMWVKAPDSTKRTWQAALNHAAALSLCGHTDWRLPNRKELRSLVSYRQADLAAWLNYVFSNVRADYYWTSTTLPHMTSRAWQVRMTSGAVHDYYGKSASEVYAWPVRSGQ